MCTQTPQARSFCLGSLSGFLHLLSMADDSSIQIRLRGVENKSYEETVHYQRPALHSLPRVIEGDEVGQARTLAPPPSLPKEEQSLAGEDVGAFVDFSSLLSLPAPQDQIMTYTLSRITGIGRGEYMF